MTPFVVLLLVLLAEPPESPLAFVESNWYLFGFGALFLAATVVTYLIVPKAEFHETFVRVVDRGGRARDFPYSDLVLRFDFTKTDPFSFRSYKVGALSLRNVNYDPDTIKSNVREFKLGLRDAKAVNDVLFFQDGKIKQLNMTLYS